MFEALKEDILICKSNKKFDDHMVVRVCLIMCVSVCVVCIHQLMISVHSYFSIYPFSISLSPTLPGSLSLSLSHYRSSSFSSLFFLQCWCVSIVSSFSLCAAVVAVGYVS